MNKPAEPHARSPECMNRNDTALLIVDVQTKLVNLIPGFTRIVWNIRRLLDAAKILNVPAAGTEQYPQGLGGSVPEVVERVGPMPAKLTFSCTSCRPIFDEWREKNIFRVAVAGIETHVCVQQTVLDLLAEGFRVYVIADATGARHAIDHEFALRRMETSGAILTTTEAAMFEWCGVAGTPEFKQLSQLVREAPPA